MQRTTPMKTTVSALIGGGAPMRAGCQLNAQTVQTEPILLTNRPTVHSVPRFSYRTIPSPALSVTNCPAFADNATLHRGWQDFSMRQTWSARKVPRTFSCRSDIFLDVTAGWPDPGVLIRVLQRWTKTRHAMSQAYDTAYRSDAFLTASKSKRIRAVIPVVNYKADGASFVRQCHAVGQNRTLQGATERSIRDSNRDEPRHAENLRQNHRHFSGLYPLSSLTARLSCRSPGRWFPRPPRPGRWRRPLSDAASGSLL